MASNATKRTGAPLDIKTDHMLVIMYDPMSGWSAPQTKPYGPLALDPSSNCLQYCTNIFEGMKNLAGQRYAPSAAGIQRRDGLPRGNAKNQIGTGIGGVFVPLEARISGRIEVFAGSSDVESEIATRPRATSKVDQPFLAILVEQAMNSARFAKGTACKLEAVGRRPRDLSRKSHKRREICELRATMMEALNAFIDFVYQPPATGKASKARAQERDSDAWF
ncbi:hypothetical protein C8J57DRAFT_1225831 [Mycena rebaudengoi]|nr:hypothetical protein C8J57DRAFT_1225831 [Mycena rebaudengoi]